MVVEHSNCQWVALPKMEGHEEWEGPKKNDRPRWMCWHWADPKQEAHPNFEMQACPRGVQNHPKNGEHPNWPCKTRLHDMHWMEDKVQTDIVIHVGGMHLADWSVVKEGAPGVEEEQQK